MDKDKDIWKQTAVIIDDILLEYKRISEAPSFESFVEISRDDQLTLEALMYEESFKRYKAIDTMSGHIMLAQNPALMSYQVSKFERLGIARGTVTRLKPKLIMTRGETKDLVDKLKISSHKPSQEAIKRW